MRLSIHSGLPIRPDAGAARMPERFHGSEKGLGPGGGKGLSYQRVLGTFIVKFRLVG